MVHEEKGHASVKLYWQIAGVLCFITFMEWGIFKMEGLRTNAKIMVPSLLVLSVAKFVIVCGWYMHLRYDHDWLRKVFGFSLGLALLVFCIMFGAMR